MFDDFLRELFAPDNATFNDRFGGLPPSGDVPDLMPPGSRYTGLPGPDGDSVNIISDKLGFGTGRIPAPQQPPSVSLPIPPELSLRGAPPGLMPPDASFPAAPSPGQFDTGLSSEDKNIIHPDTMVPRGMEDAMLDGGMDLSARANPGAGGGIPLPPARPPGADMAAPAGGPMAGDIPPPPNANPDLIQALRSLLPGNPAAPASVQDGVRGSTNPLGIDDRKLARFKAALAGGMVGGDPRFKLGAVMKGSGGALAGDLKQDKDFRDEDLKNRALTDKEKTSAVQRDLLAARAKAVTSGNAGSKLAYAYIAGRGLDPETGEVVDGSYRTNKITGEREFIPGMVQTGKADTSDRAAVRQQDADSRSSNADSRRMDSDTRSKGQVSRASLEEARRQSILDGDQRKTRELDEKIKNFGSRRELDSARTDQIMRDSDRKDTLLDDTLDNSRSRREVDSARSKNLTEGKPNGAWNKPASERWKDSQKLIMEKKKELYRDLPLAGKARVEAKSQADAELQRFEDATNKRYGLDRQGNDLAPAQQRKGSVPSTDRVVGDKEATDRGYYAKGTYDDPAKPASKEEFDAVPPGTYFVNPADGKIMRKRG